MESFQMTAESDPPCLGLGMSLTLPHQASLCSAGPASLRVSLRCGENGPGPGGGPAGLAAASTAPSPAPRPPEGSRADPSARTGGRPRRPPSRSTAETCPVSAAGGGACRPGAGRVSLPGPRPAAQSPRSEPPPPPPPPAPGLRRVAGECAAWLGGSGGAECPGTLRGPPPEARLRAPGGLVPPAGSSPLPALSGAGRSGGPGPGASWAFAQAWRPLRPHPSILVIVSGHRCPSLRRGAGGRAAGSPGRGLLLGPGWRRVRGCPAWGVGRGPRAAAGPAELQGPGRGGSVPGRGNYFWPAPSQGAHIRQALPERGAPPPSAARAWGPDLCRENQPLQKAGTSPRAQGQPAGT
ncbi:translation initiation factor IF-2-like [Panthera leo]|uniref:translation initiation factor IF-2-like n=1 Tax=Panthera leo TaxID=9689 RepID=UPI001C6A378D|nr:translation initiation factor IF-2-like [Panthera leo]